MELFTTEEQKFIDFSKDKIKEAALRRKNSGLYDLIFAAVLSDEQLYPHPFIPTRWD